MSDFVSTGVKRTTHRKFVVGAALTGVAIHEAADEAADLYLAKHNIKLSDFSAPATETAEKKAEQ